jgi:hypothetical protein
VLAAGALALLSVLAVGGWRLWVLDRDLANVDTDYGRLQDQLHAAHQQHVRATERRLRDVETATTNVTRRVDVIEPWVRYWADASRESRR